MPIPANQAKNARSAQWAERLRTYRARAAQPVPLTVEGKLTRMVGLTLEAVGCQAAVGGRCRVLVASHAPCRRISGG